MKIGIMQGRLSVRESSKIIQEYPQDWKKEKILADLLKFDYLEYIILEEKFNNLPIFSKKYFNYFNKQKLIVCENLTLTKSIFKKETKKKLFNIINRLKKYNKSKLVIPISDEDVDKNIEVLCEIICELLKKSAKNLTLSFEIEHNVKKIQEIAEKVNSTKFGITIDSGNFSVNYLKNNKLTNLKKIIKCVNHVHLKDRDTKFNSVDLGTGTIDIEGFLKVLKKSNYNGELTLETPRGRIPYDQGYTQLNYVKSFLN